MDPSPKLSGKDSEFRNQSLNGDMHKVVLTMGTPLAMYALFAGLFTLLDTLMASHVGGVAVSTVAYLSQMNLMVNAIGGGLAVGASIKVSQAFGAGDYPQVQQRMNSMFGLMGILGAIVLVLLPCTPLILSWVGTPTQFITEGLGYFSVLLVSTVVNFFNAAYINIEKVRGNTKRIFRLNLMTMFVKLGFSAIFIYIFDGTILMIAVATLIAYCSLFVFAIRNLSGKDAVFSLNFRQMLPKRSIAGPIIGISYPISIEKTAFSMGKTVVNSMVAGYGPLMVGSLGVSNNICGMVTNLQGGYVDGVNAIVSQNLSAGKPLRAIEAYKSSLLVSCLISVAGILCIEALRVPLTKLFATSATGFDPQFQNMILGVLRFDLLSCLPLAANNAAMSLLFGMGKTKLTLLINLCRVFVFRIPVLWALQGLLGPTSLAVGLMMFISNALTGILATSIALVMIRRLRTEAGMVRPSRLRHRLRGGSGGYCRQPLGDSSPIVQEPDAGTGCRTAPLPDPLPADCS